MKIERHGACTPRPGGRVERLVDVRFGCVKSGRDALKFRCPLYPRKRTFAHAIKMSALGHVWTAPSWQGESSRRRLGRCSHVFGL